MAYPNGGLIQETNSQYYEGDQIFFTTSLFTGVTCTLDTRLRDAAGNVSTGGAAANYKLFQDISGAGNNWTIVPPNISTMSSSAAFPGAGLTAAFAVPIEFGGVPTSPGTFQSMPLPSSTTSGVGLVLEFVFTAPNILASVVVSKTGDGYAGGDNLHMALPAGFTDAGGNPYVEIAVASSAIYTGPTYTVTNNLINFPNGGLRFSTPVSPITQTAVKIQLSQQSIWDNYNNYQYIKLNDVINNFVMSYVGKGKIIPYANRNEIIFHARRGLQEFSYDTLRSVKSQELTLSPSATAIFPQDYVNYVQMSWIDSFGVKHIIYPTQLTSNPQQPLLQDSDGIPTQDNYGENLESQQAITNERWKTNVIDNQNGMFWAQDYNANIYNWTWWEAAYGQRYGQDTTVANMNGWFTINDREGKFMFSSDLKDQLIILEYISDGLAYAEDMRIPKMAEQAIYMHILHALISVTSNIPEYVINRYKKERRAALRNAKIRLSEIKLDTFIQQMRGKSKWIKH